MPGWVIAIALSVLIPAAIVFVPMLVIGAIKNRRARRRRTTGPGHDRVAGAWEELVDRYSELGYDVPSKTTRINVARTLESQVEGESATAVTSLATATDHAVFSGRQIDDQQAEWVWTEAMAAVELAQSTVTKVRLFVSRYRMRAARDWVAKVARRTESTRESAAPPASCPAGVRIPFPTET
jgi:hypothetical protein